MHDSNMPYEALYVGATSSNRTISENKQYGYIGQIINYQKNKIIDKQKKDCADDIYTGEHVSYTKYETHDRQFNIDKIPVNQFLIIDNRNYSRATYSWIGFVTSIGKKSFCARIEDLRTNTSIYEEFEIEIDDLDDEEKEMLKIGSVFYWSIGYEYRNGTKKKESFIRFKRLPRFTESQINDALDLSNDLFSTLNWDD